MAERRPDRRRQARGHPARRWRADGRGGCAWLIVGIGVNVAERPGRRCPIPRPASRPQGSRLTPRRRARGLARRSCGRCLDRWQAAGFAAVREAWLARAAGLGAPVAAAAGRRGRFAAASPTWTTTARSARAAPGGSTRFTAGELFLRCDASAGTAGRRRTIDRWPRPRPAISERPDGMLLAIDVGNTNTVFALYRERRAGRAVAAVDQPRAHRRGVCRSPDPADAAQGLLARARSGRS